MTKLSRWSRSSRQTRALAGSVGRRRATVTLPSVSTASTVNMSLHGSRVIAELPSVTKASSASALAAAASSSALT